MAGMQSCTALFEELRGELSKVLTENLLDASPEKHKTRAFKFSKMPESAWAPEPPQEIKKVPEKIEPVFESVILEGTPEPIWGQVCTCMFLPHSTHSILFSLVTGHSETPVVR